MIRIVLPVLFLNLLACSPAPGRPAGGPPDRMTISQVLAAHTDSLMRIPGVVGVGEGRVAGGPSVHILVSRLTPELRARLPRSLDGYPVAIAETGVIEAQSDSS